MNKGSNTIKFEGREISYTFRKNKLSKKLRLTIRPDGSILLTAPVFFSKKAALKFMKERSSWIARKLDSIEENNKNRSIVTGIADYKKNKEKAREMVIEKIEQHNSFYNYRFNRVAIRNQRGRWGSCSALKNLNFNYRLIYLPEKIVDYIVVHELCHLKEMNHSTDFWKLVELRIPDYRLVRKKLKKEGMQLF